MLGDGQRSAAKGHSTIEKALKKFTEIKSSLQEGIDNLTTRRGENEGKIVELGLENERIDEDSVMAIRVIGNLDKITSAEIAVVESEPVEEETPIALDGESNTAD